MADASAAPDKAEDITGHTCHIEWANPKRVKNCHIEKANPKEVKNNRAYLPHRMGKPKDGEELPEWLNPKMVKNCHIEYANPKEVKNNWAHLPHRTDKPKDDEVLPHRGGKPEGRLNV